MWSYRRCPRERPWRLPGSSRRRVFPCWELAGSIGSGDSMRSPTRLSRGAVGAHRGRGRRVGPGGLTTEAGADSRATVPVLRRLYAPLTAFRVYLSMPGQNRSVSIKRVDGCVEPFILRAGGVADSSANCWCLPSRRERGCVIRRTPGRVLRGPNRVSAGKGEYGMNLVVAGGGYVGLATAVGFARHGHQVQVVDIDPERAQRLREGALPFVEPSLAEELTRTVASGALTVHGGYPDSFGPADLAFVCVDTSPTEAGDLDSSRIVAAVDDLARSVEGYLRVVIRSTVNPGTARMIEERLRAHERPATVMVNPEFLREGTALLDFDFPSRRVVGGCDAEALDMLCSLYAFSDAPLIRTDAATAELIKLAVNASLAVRVSMANEIAYLADSAGADVKSVLAGVGADPRIGMDYLSPGLGFGGSCLPKDLNALRATSRAFGVPSALFDGAANTNGAAIERVVGRTLGLLDGRETRRVCVVGLAFKPESDSIRSSQSIRLVQALMGERLSVSVYDPLATANARAVLGDTVEYLDSLETAGEDHDVIIEVHPGTTRGVRLHPGCTVLDGLARPVCHVD
ncbi:MAG: nucleotide sugar dehydrogenase [Dehalococcoidia bacterium]|nr:nucleotide sugar dehydrogenase [Dehalococcoidia bacterium]